VDYTFPPNAIVSPECKDLLARILIDNPDKRITVQQILRHPWYQKVWLLASAQCRVVAPDRGDVADSLQMLN
jgi:serine/threonine protein kinase